MGDNGSNMKKGFKKMCKNARNSFNGTRRGRGWWNPFFLGPWPWYCCPKLVVGTILLITLLLCGVNIYGLFIIILLMFLFILV